MSQMFHDVLVHSGCYNKIPQTTWFINNRNLFLTVLKAGKPKIKAPAWLHSGESLLPGSEPTPLCVLTRWKGRGSSVNFLL